MNLETLYQVGRSLNWTLNSPKRMSRKSDLSVTIAQDLKIYPHLYSYFTFNANVRRVDHKIL